MLLQHFPDGNIGIMRHMLIRIENIVIFNLPVISATLSLNILNKPLGTLINKIPSGFKIFRITINIFRDRLYVQNIRKRNNIKKLFLKPASSKNDVFIFNSKYFTAISASAEDGSTPYRFHFPIFSRSLRKTPYLSHIQKLPSGLYR